MNIPRRTWAIKLNGRRIPVIIAAKDDMIEAMQKSTFDGSPCPDSAPLGFFDPVRNKIYLNENYYGTEIFAETLSHEITHAMLRDITQLGTFNEEVIADVIGAQLMSVAEQFKTLPKGWRGCP